MLTLELAKLEDPRMFFGSLEDGQGGDLHKTNNGLRSAEMKKSNDIPFASVTSP